MNFTGRCQCGRIAYQSSGVPLALYVCHCRECQKQSASAFGISLDVPRSTFNVVQGSPKYWIRAINSGKILKCAFCVNCGTRLWHEPEPSSDVISIKGGTLDSSLDLSNAIHVWVSRKLPGIIIPPEATQYMEEIE